MSAFYSLFLVISLQLLGYGALCYWLIHRAALKPIPRFSALAVASVLLVGIGVFTTLSAMQNVVRAANITAPESAQLVRQATGMTLVLLLLVPIVVLFYAAVRAYQEQLAE